MPEVPTSVKCKGIHGSDQTVSFWNVTS